MNTNLYEETNEKTVIPTGERDEEASYGPTVTARKKDSSPVSFDDLIKKYFHSLICEDGQPIELLPLSSYVIKDAAPEHLAVRSVEDNKANILLLPNKNGRCFDVDVPYYFSLSRYDNYLFVDYALTPDEYKKCLPVIDGLDIEKQREIISLFEEDPDGFELWRQLGSIKRRLDKIPSAKTSPPQKTLPNLAKQILRRIPEERNDLYIPLKAALAHYASRHDYAVEQKLFATAAMVSMLLSPTQADTLTFADLKSMEGATGSLRDVACTRPSGWTPNILIVGNYSMFIKTFKAKDIEEISMAGISKNDYLFGSSIVCPGARYGELVNISKDPTSRPSVVLFTDCDLIGQNGQECAAIYGLIGLARNHAFNDQFLGRLRININRSFQLMFHYPKMEDCPASLLNEMDIVVEL